MMMGKSQQQKNIISQQNIQLIEQIGEGEFGTGKPFFKYNYILKLIFFSSFSFQSFLENKTE
jgi:hypothetical protein